MVAVLSGSGLGIFGSSVAALGGIGASGPGRGNDRVHINTATGNLVIQSADEVLSAVGTDLRLIRTYNSQGLLDDDNGDNWRLNTHQRLYNQTGDINTAGSSIIKVFGDGREVTYRYDQSRGAYVSSEGDGAHDTLGFNGSTWTWTEGSTRVQETYDADGRFTSTRDSDGRTISYSYTNSRLTQITDASGQVTTLIYENNNLAGIEVSSNGFVQTLTTYHYDSSGRLDQVIVDLTPENTADALVYTTTYTYDGGSRRVASISQSDGSHVAFTYELIDGQYRVRTYTDGEGRVTTFAYAQPGGSGGGSPIEANVDPTRLVTTQTSTHNLNQNALTSLGGWQAAELLENDNAEASAPKIAFDATGNGLVVWAQGTDVMVRRYDASTGTWGAASVLDSRSDEVLRPLLAIDRITGDALVTWVQSDGTAGSLYTSRFDAGTNTWSAAQLLENASGEVLPWPENSSVSIAGDHAAVVWKQSDGTSERVYLSRLVNGVWTAPALVDAGTEPPQQVQVAIDANGSAWVLWRQFSPTDGEYCIQARRWNNASQSFSSISQLDDAGDRFPQVQLDADGNGFALWGGGANVRRYDAATGQWGPQISLDAGEGIAGAPDMSVDANGDALVAWVENDGTSLSLYARRYDRATASWGAIQLLENFSTPVDIDRDISVSLVNGRGVVSWVHTGDTENYVYAVRLSDGAWGPPTLIETSTSRSGEVQTAIDVAGNTTVVWVQADDWAPSIYRASYVGPHYIVPSGASWQSLANTLYGVNSAAAAAALQAAMGSSTLTAGRTLTGLPTVLSVTSAVPGYYLVSAGDTWASITQALYGTSESAAISALQEALGNPALTAGAHLNVPSTLIYSSTGGGAAVYLQTEVTDALGAVTRYEQNAAGQLAAVTVARGGLNLRTEYQYDGSGNVTAIIEDPTGLNNATRFEYDANGNLLLRRDAVGNTITRTYDAHNQLLTETVYEAPDPDGAGPASASVPQTTHYAYDGQHHLRFVVSAAGRVTEHRYLNGERRQTLTYAGVAYPGNSFGIANLESWAASQSQSQVMRSDYAYDFRGNLETLTTYAALSDTGTVLTAPSITRFVYDQRGRLLQTIEPRGSSVTPSPGNRDTAYSTTYSYDGLGRVLAASRWNGAGNVSTTLTVYDDANRATTVTMANGLVTTTLHNLAGEVISVTNSGTSALGTTTYVYDDAGRLIQQTDPLDARSFHIYDAAGRRVGTVDHDGTLTEFIYDDASRLIKTVQYAELVSPALLGLLANGDPAAGIATLRTDASGNAADDLITRHVYNVAGQKVFTIDAAGAVSKLVYDGAGQIVRQVRYATTVAIDRNINELAVGDVTVAIDPANDRQVRSFYDADGLLRATLDPEGYLIEYRYDAGGRLTLQIAYANATQPSIRDQGTQTALLDSVGNDEEILEDAERDQRTYHFYDGQGRRIGTLDAEGYFNENLYDVAGQLTQSNRYDIQLQYAQGSTFTSLRNSAATAQKVHSTSYEYDGAGRVTQETDFQGTVTRYVYDRVGNLVSTTRAHGTDQARTIQVRYDELGRVVQELSAEGSAAITAGMSDDDITLIWNQYGVRYSYDLAGRRISATSQPNDEQTNTTRYFYDEDGRLRYEVNARGEVQERRYNALGQLRETIAYTGRISTDTLTAGVINSALTGQVDAIEDSARDARTVFTYSMNGRVATTTTSVSASPADDVVTTSLYNAFGEERERSQPINASQALLQRFTYDRRGMLRFTRSDPTVLNLTEERRYDAFGRLIEIIDARSNTTAFEHDRLARVTATIDTVNERRTTTYDAFSRVLTTTDALLNQTSYEYDEATRSMTVRTPQQIAVTTTYNRHGQTVTVQSANNTTTHSYDLNGNLTGVSDELGTLESRTYDRGGRQITQTDAVGIVTRFAYDAVNRVFTKTVDSASGGLSLVTSYVYDGQGRIERILEPGAKLTTMSYDRAGRVELIAVDPDGLNLRTHYLYDRLGRTVVTTEGYGSTMPRRTRHVYDELGRLREEVVDPTDLGGTLNLRTQHKYDNNGNRTRTIDANGHSTWYVYDAANRLTHTIDAMGSVTQRSYDDEGRVIVTRLYAASVSTATFGDVVTSVSLSANDVADRVTQAAYDRDGRERFTVDAVGTVTERTFDADGNVIRTRTYANSVAPGQYTTIAAVTGALTAAQNNLDTPSSSDRVNWTVFDERGAVRFTIDASGAVVQSLRDDAGNVTATIAYATLRSTSALTGLGDLESWAAQTAIANHSDNRTTRYWYDGAGREVFKLDAEGYLTETRYNDSLRIVSTILYRDRPTIAAQATTAQVGQNSVVTGLSATRDRISTTSTDAAGRTSRIYDTLTLTATSLYEEYRYDAVGNLTGVISPRGVELAEHNTSWARTERARLGYNQDAAALTTFERQLLRDLHTTTHDYDAAGREVRVIDPLGGVTRNTYDAAGNLIKITDARNASAHRYYDAAGRLRYQVDPLGYVTELRYDSLGNVRDEITYATPLTVGTYNETTTLQQLGLMIATDTTRDRQLTKTYDRNGLVRFITHHASPVSYTEEYEYNAFGQKRLYRDKNQAVFEYRYNGRGELTREIQPQVEVVTDVLPNVTTQLLRLETYFEYTAFGQMSLRREADGTTEQRETRYFYGHRGYQTRVELPQFAVFGPANNTSSTQTPVVQKSYDSAGNLVLEIAPKTGRTVHYYDSRNLRVASVDADNVLREFVYDPVGNLISERTYDTRLEGLQSPDTRPTARNPDDYRELRYEYNANNQRVRTETREETLFSYQDLLAGGPGYYRAVVATLAEYDANGNVVKIVDGNQNSTYSYFDAAGNRVLQVDAAGYVIRWEYNAQGQLRRETQYAGQLSSQFQQQLLGTTTLVQTILDAIPGGDNRITEYDYDRLGRVSVERKLGVEYSSVNATSGALSSTTGDLETRFEYDGNGNLTAEIRPNSHGRTDYEYDALGRRKRQRDPQFLAFNGRDVAMIVTREETSWQYDAYGNVAVKTELAQNAADDRQQRFHYDTAGNLRVERDAFGAVTSRDYSLAGAALAVTRQVTDVYGAIHTYLTRHAYDVLGRETSRQDVEQVVTGGSVTYIPSETYETRYNAHGDIEAKGSNGQYQEQYIYDRLGRLFWTNKENGTPRLHVYDANGNAVLQLHAINSDLRMVNSGSGLRPVVGPADAPFFIDVQLTFSLYDKRNLLTVVFQPPMRFGELISNPPTVVTTGTPGLPPELLGDLAAYLPTALTGGTQSQGVPLPEQTTIANNSPSPATGWGYRPDEHRQPQPVAVTPAELGLPPAGNYEVSDPPVRETLSDVISGNGTVRTVREKVTKRKVQTTISVQSDLSVLKTVTITNEVTERETRFTRSTTGPQPGENEQSVSQQWTVEKDETYSTRRTTDTKSEKYQRNRLYDGVMSYNYAADIYPGTLAFTPETSIPVTYQYWFETDAYVEANVPALDAWGAGPTTVVIDRTDFPGMDRQERQINGAGYVGFHMVNRGGASFTLRFYKGGQLIATVVSPGTHVTARVPAIASLKAQHPSATNGLLRLLNADETPRSDFWGNSHTMSNAGGTEIIFQAPYAGAFTAGAKYEYIARDANGNYLNRVVGTFGSSDHRNQHTYTVSDRIVQTKTYVLHDIGNYSNTPQTAESTAQNNYLRQLLRSITQGEIRDNRISNVQTYNAFGEVITQQDAELNTTHFTYNDLGKMTVQQQPVTNIETATGAVQPVNPTTRYYYDEIGQLIGHQDANSELLAEGQKYYSTRVLVNGRLEKEFDAHGNATRYVYDRLGDKRQAFDALNRETSYQYDQRGALTRVAYHNANGTEYSFDEYEYDEAGNRIAHTNAKGVNNRERYLYDGQNRITRHISFQGRITDYDYDYSSAIGSIGGFIKTTTTVGVTNGVVGDDTEIDHIDYFGRIRYHRDLGGHEFNYYYNNAGWLRRQTGTTAVTGANARNNQEIVYEYYQNGYLKSIDDLGISSYSTFQYDKRGNRTLETYSQTPITSGSQARHPYQVATASYDALNRVISVEEAGKFRITYTYDAVGNRRSVTSQYFDLLANSSEQQQFYYAYDRMNRFTITMGQLSGGQIVRGTEGYEIEYDVLGRRSFVQSDHINKQTGAPQYSGERYTYDRIDTVRETFMYNQAGTLVGRALRENNAVGETTDYREFNVANTQTKYIHYDYDLDGLLIREEDRLNNDRRERTTYTYVGNGILTGTFGNTVNALGQQVSNSQTVTLAYEYDKWDSYKEKNVTVTATAPSVRGWVPGVSRYRYNSNGHIVHLEDAQAARTIDYVNNHLGQVLKRYEIDHELGSDKPPMVRNFYYLNGIGIGDVGTDPVTSRIDYAQAFAEQMRNGSKVHPYIGDRVTPVTSADFDQNYRPINPNYPARTAGTHIVQTGDSLQSIARSVWGDASLWYLIANANGITNDEQLVAGLRLVIPNVVTNIHNNAETFRPYDATLALGDTTPTLPAPPPPASGKKGCGGFGVVLVLIVALVATVITAGALAPASVTAAGTAGAAGAGSLISAGTAVLGGAGGLAGFGAAVAGGVVGAAVSQGVAIAAGLQEDFDWKGVALGAIGAGVSFGLGSLATGSGSLQAVSNFAKNNPYTFAALNGAASSALTQGIAVSTGLQSSFNWRNVAISSLAAPAAKAFGQGVERFVPSAGTFGTEFASAIGGSLVLRAFGSREDSMTIVLNAVGQAVGGSIVDAMQASSLPEAVRNLPTAERKEYERLARNAGINPSGRQANELLLEIVAARKGGVTRERLAQLTRDYLALSGASPEQVDAAIGTLRDNYILPSQQQESVSADVAVSASRLPDTNTNALAPFGNVLVGAGRIFETVGSTIEDNPALKYTLLGLDIAAGPAMWGVRTAISESPLGDFKRGLEGAAADYVAGQLMEADYSPESSALGGGGAVGLLELALGGALAAGRLAYGLIKRWRQPTRFSFDNLADFVRETNDAAPNAIYQFGKVEWHTDRLGRPAMIEGDWTHNPVGRNDPKLQTLIGHQGASTDVGVHLWADSAGGPTSMINVVPGNGKRLGDGKPNMNQGEYGTFERKMREFDQAGHKVRVRYLPKYVEGNESRRPDFIAAQYRLDDGAWEAVEPFENRY